MNKLIFVISSFLIIGCAHCGSQEQPYIRTQPGIEYCQKMCDKFKELNCVGYYEDIDIDCAKDKVYSEWDNSFESFYNWSLANGYSNELTIDRKNVNGNYEPSNCRWVTMKVQGNNRGNNRVIEFEGQTHTLTEWSRIKNIGFKTLDTRIKANWLLEDVFNKPINLKYRHINKKMKVEVK